MGRLSLTALPGGICNGGYVKADRVPQNYPGATTIELPPHGVVKTLMQCDQVLEARCRQCHICIGPDRIKTSRYCACFLTLG